jgi:LysR family glycine cleavage system transcriptional activator
LVIRLAHLLQTVTAMASLRAPQLLTGLRDFEAAARCGSFATAAAELGISPSAVSQQVKSLETRLGVTLFDRKPQSLSLTMPGKKLLATLSSAFELIEGSLSALQPPEEIITLSMPAVFAGSWFLPRMMTFRANYPRFEVIPRTSGNLLEPGLDGTTAAIRHGRAGWGGLDCRFLFNEVLLPVCSPKYQSESLAKSAAESHRLLVAEDRPSIWDEWTRVTAGSIWSASVTVLGDYSLVTQAAMNGHGIALLDRNLLSRQLNLGLLVAVADSPQWETGDGWYLVFDQRVSIEEHVTALLDWLLSEVALDVRYELLLPAIVGQRLEFDRTPTK